MEITVVVEQRNSIFDTPRGDQHIDGLANGNSATAQISEIARRRHRDRIAGHRYNREAAQK
jgi:hypothetical protein